MLPGLGEYVGISRINLRGFRQLPGPRGGRNVNLTQGDMGMRSSLVLGFVLLAGFLVGGPAHASFSDEHLELLDVTEVVDEYGLIVFTGSVRNTHTVQSVTAASIYVILKQDGQIIAIYRGFPDSSLKDLAPGETRSFEVETDYAKGEYDAFNVRVEGLLEPPDASLITGSFGLVEESLNLTQTREGRAIFYGELFNGTNALIRHVDIQFEVYPVNWTESGVQ